MSAAGKIIGLITICAMAGTMYSMKGHSDATDNSRPTNIDKVYKTASACYDAGFDMDACEKQHDAQVAAFQAMTPEQKYNKCLSLGDASDKECEKVSGYGANDPDALNNAIHDLYADSGKPDPFAGYDVK